PDLRRVLGVVGMRVVEVGGPVGDWRPRRLGHRCLFHSVLAPERATIRRTAGYVDTRAGRYGRPVDPEQPSRRHSTAYVVAPPAGHGPGLLVLHGWWGMTAFVRRLCDRLADEGFAVIAPDL